MRFVLALLVLGLPLSAETGSLTIHMILHAIGEERYEIATEADGLTLKTTLQLSDRGNQRITTAVMRMSSDYSPLSLTLQDKPRFRAEGTTGTVQEDLGARSSALPARYFAIYGPSPFALQMAMMRYWKAHGRPAELPVLRGKEGAPPIRIQSAGRESITVAGKTVALERYTIANLMFGREIVWMDERGDLAAAMTFAGGLPMEAVRTEYVEALPQLYKSGVAQQMTNLRSLTNASPWIGGSYAIAGARLIDATGAPPVEDSVVIVRDGKIAQVGRRSQIAMPRGMRVVEAKGQTLLPGLWEMHTHYSGVEFGPALLASGITTARDCGGEFDYLVAQRDAIEKGAVPSPRLLLAGLVDAGGLKAFGHVTAETVEEGRAVVNRYHAAGFQQIKLYTFLEPDVIRAIADEAHNLGMTVTGHVPRVFNAFEGVEAGMDQINHLNYVSSLMRGSDDAAQKAIRFFKEHGTVVDPTAGWGEMASHSKDVDVATFEPGIMNAPFVLDAKFRGMAGATTAEQMRSRIAQMLGAIGALHKAGVTIVPGSDTGLVGYGLHREIELYVEAGMTPMEAIQSATIVSARAMRLERDSGTVEVGKRADLILVDGDPLRDIRALRNVVRVMVNGRAYDPATLWRSVGFAPERR